MVDALLTGRAGGLLGTMKPTKAGHFVQYSLGAGLRKGTTIPREICPTEREADERRRRIGRLILRLREAGLAQGGRARR